MSAGWEDTPAGRFHTAGGERLAPGSDPDRAEARAAFDATYRPHETTAAMTAYECQRAYAMDRDAFAMRGNWMSGDEQIAERLRRMKVGNDAVRVASAAEVYGPADGITPPQIEAQMRIMRGIG